MGARQRVGYGPRPPTSPERVRIFLIEALGCIQINRDVGNTAIAEILPYLQMVQARPRSLLIRIKLDPEDLALLRAHLSPDGLYLQVVVETAEDARKLGAFLAPCR